MNQFKNFKKILSISIGILISISFFSFRTDAAALTNGLVGYWNFDEGSGTIANDSSGNGNNGTISGVTWTTGKVGNGALSFDGVDK